MKEIDDLINSIPDEYNNLSVMADPQKEFYKEVLHIRLNEIYIPVAKEIEQQKENNYRRRAQYDSWER